MEPIILFLACVAAMAFFAAFNKELLAATFAYMSVMVALWYVLTHFILKL